MESPLLTVGEIATILKVSEKTIYRHAQEIQGYIKICGNIRFNREILLKSLTPKPKRENDGNHNGNRHNL